MIRRLTKQGNSTCLIIEKQIRELLDITTETPLKISVENRRLIIDPVTEQEQDARFEKALDKTTTRYAKGLKRLAK